MPMIRLIATDIDGTLVEEAAMNLNPEYFDVIQEFRKRGVLFVAASGRQRKNIERFFEPIKDDIFSCLRMVPVLRPKNINMWI